MEYLCMEGHTWNYAKSPFKETGNVISSDSKIHLLFTTAPFSLLSQQKWWRFPSFQFSTILNSDNFFMARPLHVSKSSSSDREIPQLEYFFKQLLLYAGNLLHKQCSVGSCSIYFLVSTRFLFLPWIKNSINQNRKYKLIFFYFLPS